jgi:hypothetical protein
VHHLYPLKPHLDIKMQNSTYMAYGNQMFLEAQSFMHQPELQMVPLPQYYAMQQHAYALPRRSNSMTNLTQFARAQPGERTDTKPRLNKTEVEKLERYFQQNHKPTSITKRNLADELQVDIARINNWFQNRRAKAKQEKKQLEFGLREVNHAAYSAPASPSQADQSSADSSTPTTPTQDGNTFSSGDVSSGTQGSGSMSNGEVYDDLTPASMDSINRTVEAAREAHQRGDFDQAYQQPAANCQFDIIDSMGLEYPSFTDAAPFQHEVPVAGPMYSFPDGLYQEHSFSGMSFPDPVGLQDPQLGDNCFMQLPEEDSASMPTFVPTYPSQLLGQPSPEAVNAQAHQFSPVPEMSIVDNQQSYFDQLTLRSPPPPSNLAIRRSRQRIAGLQMASLYDRASTGPKTTTHSENARRPTRSPTVAMRRVSSATDLKVAAGRVQKSSQVAQSSMPPAWCLALAARGIREAEANPKPRLQLRSRTWAGKPRSPPTPRSPKEATGTGIRETLASHDESVSPSSSADPGMDGTGLFDPAGHNESSSTGSITSPPETPGHPRTMTHWNYEIPDDTYYTPNVNAPFAGGFFPPQQTQYISPVSGSQPPTPAFPAWNSQALGNGESPSIASNLTVSPYLEQGPPYIKASSPIFGGLVPSVGALTPQEQGTSSDYFFPMGADCGAMMPCSVVRSSKSPMEHPREKTYTFNNATQKDFES